MSEPFDRQALITYRLEQARETLRDASLLFENGGSSSSVVNRAYYTIFYATLALMVERQISASKHSGVIARFDQEFVKSGIFPKAMSRILHHAFDLRQIGDYRELLSLTREQAQKVLQDAEEFLLAVEARFSK
jgi:uncharacterized protein (UPF0332 family)